MTTKPNEVFSSYAPEDVAWIRDFHKHLKLLQKNGIIRAWYDDELLAGTPIANEHMQHLNSANIILLFISADFFNSERCNQDLSRAIERSRRKEALVIPVIVRSYNWKDNPDLADLKPLPHDENPLDMWENRDEALAQVVEGIKVHVQQQHVPEMKTSLLNIPFSRNPLFTGREDVLEKLHDTLQKQKNTILTQAISGLGGVGKTQTALEYAYRYQDDYSCIIWLRAESREILLGEISRLAQELNLPGSHDQDVELVVQSFLNWLSNQRDWLLILDNADDLSLAREYIPKNSSGHILVTTRKQAVGASMRSISLDIMPKEIGAYFLLKRSKRIEPETLLEEIDAEEMRQAQQLSDLLGGLPLALDQAGGYIEQKQCGLNRYRQLYEKEHGRFLAQHGDPDDTSVYHYTVATTWSISFEALAKEQPFGSAATDLLRFCSFLAPDNIILKVLEVVAEELGPQLGPVVADPLHLEEVVALLLRYSLIGREEEVISLHRLVQTVIRDSLKPQHGEWLVWAKRAIEAMLKVFPDSDKHEVWGLCQYLLPHLLTCATWIKEGSINDEVSAQLLNKAGYYLYQRAIYTDAVPLFELALSIWRQVLGEQHPDTAGGLNNLAALYQAQGEYGKAESLYERALQISEQVLGRQHPDTAQSLNNLAVLYQAQGEYRKAEPLYARALQIREQVLGGQHPQTAGSLNNLAVLYQAQGEYKKAEPLYERALQIREQVLGGQHPQTAGSLNNLAHLYQVQGEYKKAEPLYERALQISEQVLGGQHPDTAISLNNLAGLYQVQGEYKKAEPLYERALQISEQVLGGQHPYTATILNSLAVLHQAQGEYGKAEPLYEQALSIRQQVLGEQHPQTATSLNNLAALYKSQGKYKKAEPLYEQALAIVFHRLGENHPSTQTIAGNYLALKEMMEQEK